MPNVKATREGLLGQTTASGYRIDPVVPFVALPCRRAVGRFVHVSNPATGASAYAVVLDVGPWNTDDEAYVFGHARPQAESGIDMRGRPTNQAGIDLGERVWRLLGMRDNGPVNWAFLPEPCADMVRQDPDSAFPGGPAETADATGSPTVSGPVTGPAVDDTADAAARAEFRGRWEDGEARRHEGP